MADGDATYAVLARVPAGRCQVSATGSAIGAFRAERGNERRTFALTRPLDLVLGLIGVVVIAVISLRLGSLKISTDDVWNALFHDDSSSYNQTVIRSLRLPRTIIALGASACIFLGHQLNVLSLGDEAARGLGMQTDRIRILCSILVVFITGAAVAAAGPIGFVGLAISLMVRSVIGPDDRWILPYSLVFGAPILIYLARKRSVAN